MITILFFSSFLGIVGTLIAGRLGGSQGAIQTATTSTTVSLGALFVLCYSEQFTPLISFEGGAWFATGNFTATWGLALDPTNVAIVLAVTLVSWVVVIYSGWYIASEPQIPYFLALIQGFVFFMLCLLIADSLPMIFLGWEGIGVLSFLLISFWHTRVLATQAAMQAFVINRIGDLVLILAIAILAVGISGTSLDIYLATASTFETNHLVLYLILGGAAGKSAQIGLQSWLPSAIEAPTPISALIHAATLVTAGVYLITRLAPPFSNWGGNVLIMGLGTATLLLAGLIGLTQTDIKRTIAFSTCSQVGYIVLGAGNGSTGASMFLLLTHALYKALLFISAGAVIHASGNNQDIRLMGGNGASLPMTKEIFLLASLALCAFPFSSGDFSKDLLVEQQGYTFFTVHHSFWLCALLGTALTGAYSGRLIRLVFSSEPRMASAITQHDPSMRTLSVLTALALCSFSSGFIFSELFMPGVGVSSSWELNHTLNADFMFSNATTILPLIFASLGLTLGFQTSLTSETTSSTSLSYLVSLNQGLWDLTLPQLSVWFTNNLATRSFKSLDFGAWENLGPLGLSSALWVPVSRPAIYTLPATLYYTIANLILLFFVFFIPLGGRT